MKNKFTKLFAIILMASITFFVACSSKDNSNSAVSNTSSGSVSKSSTQQSKQPLVAYFSYSGTTEKVAKEIADKTNGTLVKIEEEVPYTKDDTNWNVSSARVQVEQKSGGEILPAINESTYNQIDRADFDTVIIGYPIWSGIEPMIIRTLISHYNGFDGKKVYVFSTSGSSNGDKAFVNIKSLVSESKDYIHLKAADMSEMTSKVDSWISKNNL